MIIAVFGLPGSGKSFFASRLAKKLQARYVSSDLIRNKLIAVRTYSEDEKMQVYNEMINEMRKAMAKNERIVLDATFYKKNIRNKFKDTALESGRDILFIEVQADQSITKQRLGKKRQHSEADYDVYLKIKDNFEPLLSKHLTLHSTQNNIKDMLNKGLRYINKANGKISGN